MGDETLNISGPFAHFIDETDITESDIWADIDAAFTVPPRLPGDIDCRQIMARYGLAETSARGRMDRLVRSGDWEYAIVQDDTSSSGRRKVIRKVR